MFHQVFIRTAHPPWCSLLYFLVLTGKHFEKHSEVTPMFTQKLPVSCGSHQVRYSWVRDQLQKAPEQRHPRSDDHIHTACPVSDVASIRSAFRTGGRLYHLVTLSDYTWGCCYTHTCDWIEQLIASPCFPLPEEIKGLGDVYRGRTCTNGTPAPGLLGEGYF